MTTPCLIDTNVLIDYLNGSAMVEGLPLMTSNTADFKAIPGLGLLAPCSHDE